MPANNRCTQPLNKSGRNLATNVTRTIQDDVDDGSTPMCARLDPALVQQTLYVRSEYCVGAYLSTQYSQIHSHFFLVIFWSSKSMYDHSCSIFGDNFAQFFPYSSSALMTIIILGRCHNTWLRT
jgi:hypothetical protein